MNLTPKQQAFVDEYVVDLNGAQAAIRAGYSEKTAKEIAAENLTKPNIKAAVDAAILSRSKKTERKAADVLADVQELAKTAKAEYMAAPENHNMLNGALKALELEGKHLGVGTKVELSGNVGVEATITDFTNMNGTQIEAFIKSLSDEKQEED
jgi:phage terminase small subunit